ncbi:leucine-rich repeat-containing G-protein coupled receptor 5-like [Tropilaelaps mercedesae]|uniref:Leucine-rich repeat-containing G-protein coupled receptor 5-like n=1 Tax=Tropilaelaps mercedesae TaxID=418985 RepID=A0A1V9XKF1_9ACAR|nr:leucine-rich repeat-containing G-protein coupled receptor 5-like [Tropilaelaps mercedesae]
MPCFGKTFVQCLWIGAVLAGGHSVPVERVPVNVSKGIPDASPEGLEPSRKHPCVCIDRYKNVECDESLRHETVDARYFRYEILCHSLSSGEPLRQLYRSLRSVAPDAQFVISVHKLSMAAIPARFLAGVKAHIVHLNTSYAQTFDSAAFEGLETRVLDLKSLADVPPPLEAISRIPKLGTLMLNGFHLEVVSKGLFPEGLTTLGLSSCAVRHVEEDAFPRGLLILNLNGNPDLTATSLENAFRDMSRLRTLVLQNTGVSNPTKDTFKGLKSLTTLHLSNCNIKQLDDDVFSLLPKLDSLYLGRNSLRHFGFMLGTNVSSLSIDDNNLTALDEALFEKIGARRLRALNLSNNGFTEVPHTLRHLSQLTMLSMRGNHISKLSWSALNVLRKLRTLDIGHNELITTEGSPDLPDLWLLDLSGNLLEDLQGTLTTLRLGKLDLASNRFEKLRIDELPKTLRSIRLEGRPTSRSQHCRFVFSLRVFRSGNITSQMCWRNNIRRNYQDQLASNG